MGAAGASENGAIIRALPAPSIYFFRGFRRDWSVRQKVAWDCGDADGGRCVHSRTSGRCQCVASFTFMFATYHGPVHDQAPTKANSDIGRFIRDNDWGGIEDWDESWDWDWDCASQISGVQLCDPLGTSPIRKNAVESKGVASFLAGSKNIFCMVTPDNPIDKHQEAIWC